MRRRRSSRSRDVCLEVWYLSSRPPFLSSSADFIMQSMFQNKQRLVIISSFLAVVTGILVHFAWNHYQQEGRDRVNLIIGILSARHNFKEREIIRKSWLKRTKLNTSSQELNWVAFFVIGNRDCLVPESDRVSPFSCSRVNITSQDLESSYSSSLTTSNTGKTNCNPVVGLSFQVWMNHD